MTLSLISRKSGMTRIFEADGTSIPVTVLEIVDQKISQIKEMITDGYVALQVAYGNKQNRKVTKALQGHYTKAGIDPAIGMMEFRVESSDGFALGAEIPMDLIHEGELVDVRSLSRGKGFAGPMKRNNFTMGDATHGNSLSHRTQGSIGMRQTPGRVFKGKKMSGRMGYEQVTVQNLQVIRVLTDKRLILVRGGVPGAPGSYVIIKPAVKAKKKV
jgi:large subunit ribosomal protein L3